MQTVETAKTEVWATEIGALYRQRGWTQQRLIYELRRVAHSKNVALPGDETLKFSSQFGCCSMLCCRGLAAR